MSADPRRADQSTTVRRVLSIEVAALYVARPRKVYVLCRRHLDKAVPVRCGGGIAGAPTTYLEGGVQGMIADDAQGFSRLLLSTS